MPDLTGKDIGRYHVIEPIGQGGMAEVYKALDTTLEREVALKVIRAEEFGSAVLARIQQRFEREAKTLAKLNHPNIVPIIDYGQYDGAPYLVMPFFQGGTLREQLGGPVDEAEAARIVLLLADALGYAHQKGVLHRDIKPANILLTEGGQPMLTDFGIAKLLDSRESQSLTGTGVGIGTPEYMAPEQGMGKEVDARADVYALGVVLYELVTGQKPYTADTPFAVVLKHMSDPLPRPRELNPRVSEECEAILFKSLAKQPEHRYADMEALRAAMGKLAAGEKPTPAAPLAMDMPDTEDFEEWTPGYITDVLGTGLKLPETPEKDTSAYETRPVEVEPPVPPVPASPPPLEAPKPRRNPWLWVGLAGVICGGILITILLPQGSRQAPIPTITLFPTSTNRPQPTANVTAQPTPSLTPVYPPACTEIGQRWVNPQDNGEMVCVPAGEFWMGAAEGDSWTRDEEKPGRLVYLDAYWIDRFEVTNAQYKECVSAGWCSPPYLQSSITRDTYYSNSTYKDFPVIYVSWGKANAYCEWAGEGLPTEAQWEKAARGTDGRLYPWGNQEPGSSLANFSSSDTTAVGSFPAGASPYGAEDMAGNVWEWVADWYSESYYQSAPARNPIGPESGEYRVLRGGSWGIGSWYLRSSLRSRNNPDYTRNYYGFRCSLSPQ